MIKKKQHILIIAIALLCTISLVGCNDIKKANESANVNKTEKDTDTKKSIETITEKEEPISVKADFMDVRWTRSTDGDTEYIFFSSDGSFSYSCACGNPVNDSDLCEGYAYNEEKKEITLQCFEKTEDMVTSIIVKKCDNDSIELDFDGEIRIFTKSQEEES